MQPRMRFDDAAWEASETDSDSWVAGLFQPDTLRAIGDFMIKHRRGVPIELCQPRAGTFNVSFRMKFEDGGSALIRFSKPGTTMFPEEIVRHEVATMRYIQEHTSIPVPFILHWGTGEESPLGLGPFILMEYVEHAMDLGEALNTPTLGVDDRPVLDPAVDIGKLEMLYGQLADILLQLSRCSLPRIGSLMLVDDFTWEPKHRPLSMAMIELVRLGTLPRSKLPATTFETASDYFQALANLHCEHLYHQRNDAIVGVVDREFTYAAPVQFSQAPPWWLLLEQPEYWSGGVEAWERIFESRLPTFLKVLVEREETALRAGRLNPEQRLSGPMRRSWENGDFWVAYAARKSFAFDMAFWERLDSRFFGPCAVAVEDRWKERLALLTEQERLCMERVVSRKVEQMKTRELAWEPDEMS
ncbi:phosphotransferase family protein [Aspergillus brunneoviolaceus CBS 621.78]|uniref:Phosphotransferase family protein n=1 Tax=Aspergillus brunneoviolaceus CBS 621.78 TaxID=1450534 RepID=A0ACD1GDL0_9EURO|nr:phosphotransferase family protein [Aspergillus brunneoviolaceus CBS 621.78]RAH47260.1 phosphotransferase family protein [Aspergillus brunneoviolaceus CBS 621.78]